jgi:trypsin
VKSGKRRQLSVFAGSPWISPTRRRARIKVTAVVLDPADNGRRDSHDFAVLTLASAPDAQPIPLASGAEQRLKTTRERIFGARKCDRTYGKSRGFQGRSMICALGERIGRIHSRLAFHATSCEGDSGAPLVADTLGGPRLIGAVSSGTFPCGLGGASIYARVASRLGFIQRVAGLP